MKTMKIQNMQSRNQHQMKLSGCKDRYNTASNSGLKDEIGR